MAVKNNRYNILGPYLYVLSQFIIALGVLLLFYFTVEKIGSSEVK